LKSNPLLVLILAIISAIVGFLLSGVSFVGRTGINLLYKEYRFLKVWWKGALAVFVVYMLFLIIQSGLSKARNTSSNRVHVIALVIAVAGLCYCYYDFHHALSHRLLGMKFHFGVYLFFIGWIVLSVALLGKRQEEVVYKHPGDVQSL
jgi:hypothetical protein